MTSFRIKLVLLAVVALFIIMVIYQNLALFTHTETLRLNLLAKEYVSGPILLSMYFVAFFLMGLLISYFHGLSARFKAKNEIKGHLATIVKLEEEIEILKKMSPKQVSPPSPKTQNV